jgi:hypothetical protein
LQNDNTHISWQPAATFDKKRIGKYLLYMSKPFVGSHTVVGCVAQISNGTMFTIGSLFEWDALDDEHYIIAWAEISDEKPDLSYFENNA